MKYTRRIFTLIGLLISVLIAALLFALVPTAHFAAAEDVTAGGSDGTSDEGTGETIEEPEEPEPEPAPSVARVTLGSLSAEYSDISAAFAVWGEGATLTLLSDVSVSTVTVSVTCTLDLNGYTFQGTSGRTLRVSGALTISDSSLMQGGEIAGGGVRIERGGSLTLASGYLTDNTAEDGAGVYVSDGGSFTMTGGTIAGNTVTGNGGGVYVSGGATLSMTGGRVVENTAAGDGGGVYAAGEVALSGGASVTGNTAGGEKSNLYLAAGQQITVNSLSGQVGVSAPSGGTFAVGTATGFTSDSSAYDVHSSGSRFSLVLSPLDSVTAVFVSAENVYPTSDVQSLRAGLTVTGVNKNGSEYPADMIGYTIALPEGVEALTVGANTIALTATGNGGETAETTFTVNVVAPSLTGIEAQYRQSATVYFDSAPDILVPDLTVTGTFNDGLTRPIGRTAEETHALSGEDYINASYEIAGSFEGHENGVVTVTVRSGSFTAPVEVTISRHVINTADIPVQDAVEVERTGNWGVSPAAFTPELPDGVTASIEVLGAAQNGNLSAGTYTVRIDFSVTDEKNYELAGGSRQATLTVYYASLTAASEDGSVFFEVTREGGIPLSWELSIEDVTDEVNAPKLDSGMESRQIFAISLRDGGNIVNELDTPITVRIRLDSFFAEKDVTLYRLAADGGHIAVESTRDGDYLVFTTSSVQAQYAVAYDAGFGMYLALTIVFGVLCIGGAVLLIWYFKHKKKLDMSLPKQDE